MQQPNSAADAYFGMGYDMGGSTLTFPEVSPMMLPWNLPQQAHAYNPAHYSPREPDPFPQPYLFNHMMRRAPFGGFEASESLGQVVHPGGSAPFGLQAELQKLTAQEIMDAKALAASKSHSEAERRRRERINNHLARLRSLLPNTTKTDKASLLAEVIQHVKELKRQTSIIEETSPVPTETDEVKVDEYDDEEEDGRRVVRASICCEDRPDLLPDLIKALKAMRLRTLKAEITTLGGRVKNVLFVTGDRRHQEQDDEEDEDRDVIGDDQQFCISSIEEALKGVMEKSSSGGGGDENGSSGGGVKRQRTNTTNSIL